MDVWFFEGFFFIYIIYLLKLRVRLLSSFTSFFRWNRFQVEPDSLGNDSSGDPAILVGDDGLASGPMVAVSFFCLK